MLLQCNYVQVLVNIILAQTLHFLAKRKFKHFNNGKGCIQTEYLIHFLVTNLAHRAFGNYPNMKKPSANLKFINVKVYSWAASCKISINSNHLLAEC